MVIIVEDGDNDDKMNNARQGCESPFIFCGSGSSCSSQCGSDPAALKMRIGIQPNKICKKFLDKV